MTGNSDENGVYYTVDFDNRVAIVGKLSTTQENAVNTSRVTAKIFKAPAFVVCKDKPYPVVGFDRYAFFNNKTVESVEFGPFIGVGQTEEKPAVWDCTFRGTEALKQFIVKDNAYYSSKVGAVSGVLYGNPLNAQGATSFTRLIKYPEGLTETSFVVPNSVTVLENYAFAGNGRLQTVSLNKVNVIGSHAFFNVTELATVKDWENVYAIGDSAFENTRLTTFLATEALARIGERAFYGSALSGTVEINYNVVEIGELAFGRCVGISAFSLVDRATGNSVSTSVNKAYRVGGYGELFADSKDGDVLMQFPAAREILGGVYDMTGWNVYEISPDAFFGAEYLKEVILSDKTAIVGSYAFANCIRLKTAYLGAEYYGTGVADAAGLYSYDLFDGCGALRFISVSPENANFCNDSVGALYSRDLDVLYCYPSGIQRVQYTVPSSVTKIYDNAFKGNTVLKQVVVATTDKISIGSRAFANCAGLKEVYYVCPQIPEVGEKIYDNVPVGFKTRYKNVDGEWSALTVWCERAVESFDVIEQVPNDSVDTNEYLMFFKSSDGAPLEGVYAIVTTYTGTENGGGLDANEQKFYLYADENGRVRFSTVNDGLKVLPKIHLHAQKDGYYAYDYTLYLDLDMAITYVTLTQEPTIMGVSCEGEDINSHTQTLNLAKWRDEVAVNEYDETTDELVEKEVLTQYNGEIEITVLGFWDPDYAPKADGGFYLSQAGRRIPAKATLDGNACTFIVSPADLLADTPIEATVAVAKNGAADGESLTCTKTLNIQIINFTLTEEDVDLDTGAFELDLGEYSSFLKKLLNDFEFKFSDNISLTTEIDGDELTARLSAGLMREGSGKVLYSSYKEGYEKNIKGSTGNTYFYQMISNGYTYNIRFARGMEANNYYYYRVHVQKGMPGGDYNENEANVAYGGVYGNELKKGRLKVAQAALAIYKQTDLWVTDPKNNGKTLRDDYEPFCMPYLDPGDTSQDKLVSMREKINFEMGLGGEFTIVFADGRMKLVKSSVYGYAKTVFKLESQWVVWSIPLTLEVELSAENRLVATLTVDESKFGLGIDELRLDMEAEIEASLGVGCSLASAGVYGGVGSLLVIDIIQESKFDPEIESWKLTGELGVYGKLLGCKVKKEIWGDDVYLVDNRKENEKQITKAYALSSLSVYDLRAATFLASGYEYSAAVSPDAEIVKVGNAYYRLRFENVYEKGAAGYDPYNAIKLLCAKWNGAEFVDERIVDDNGYMDGAYDTYVGKNELGEDTLYIVYTQQSRKLTAADVEDTSLVATGLSLKTVEIGADGEVNALQTVVDGTENPDYKYAAKIGKAGGALTVTWAENKDNNIFGVSPYNRYDEVTGEMQIFTTQANSVRVAQYVDGGWRAEVLKEGLSAVTDTAISESGEIYYVVDEDGDLAETSDRTLYKAAIGGAVETIDVGSVLSLREIGDEIWTYVLGETGKATLQVLNGEEVTDREVVQRIIFSLFALDDQHKEEIDTAEMFIKNNLPYLNAKVLYDMDQTIRSLYSGL
ncbi:MAG: leucine-rich repeat protein, partial [Clostridia bacterium]|nr:leucine-rich repeat protein [Clostridia bacterium]